MATDLVPFARSVAGTAVSLQQASIMNSRHRRAEALELQPFERGRKHYWRSRWRSRLACTSCSNCLTSGTPTGRPDGFTELDRQTAGAAAEVGTELLRQALAQRNVQQVLFDAIARESRPATQ